MRNTGIQWCDDTVNPSMGCDGCALFNPRTNEGSCYAFELTAKRKGNPGYPPAFSEVTKFEGRMAEAARWPDLTGTTRPNKPWLNGKPRMIFVSDMGDALSEAIEFDYLMTEIIDVVSTPEGKRHEWLWLTKRAAKMAKFSDWLVEQDTSWPSNLWAGTSILSQKDVDKSKMIKHLESVGDETTTRFISAEPQLQMLRLHLDKHPGIHWVIGGGESGPKARPFDPDWARAMRDECFDAGVAFFLKQFGSKPTYMPEFGGGISLSLVSRHGDDWDEWPEGLRVREVPQIETATE